MISFFDYTFEELTKNFLERNISSTSALHLFNWYYKKKKAVPCELRLSNHARNTIYSSFNFDLPKIKSVAESNDRTVKFLISFDDQLSVEAVLIPFQGKYSICLSSQVGCAMNCSFCFTGTQGLSRHLETREIVTQFLVCQNWLTQNRPNDDWISNIVFMGQGEPLHNFNNVRKACSIFTDQRGFSIGPQKITVSTSGYLPGLLKWKEQPLKVNLALSLHATNPKIRESLIPISKKYPLEDVLSTLDQIPLLPKQFFTFEYLMIDGLNDSIKDATELAEVLKLRRSIINLIPFNPFPGSVYQRPTDDKINLFKSILDAYQIPTMIRKTKGDQVLAACGQLNSNKELVMN